MVEPIGNTPLLRLRDPPAPPVSTTPSSSSSIPRLHQGQASQAHDRGRPARGELTPGKVILDSTLGNTGIAFAMTGAARAASSRTTRIFFRTRTTPPTGRRTDDTTALGIWEQTGGRSTHFVATNGNQWNGDGCRRGLKERWWQQIYEHTYVARGAGERRDGKPEEVER